MDCHEGTARDAKGVACREGRGGWCAGEQWGREAGPGLRGPEGCLDFLPCGKQDFSRIAKKNGWPGKSGSPGREDPLEEELATHSSPLAWEISWTVETGGLQSIGSQRVGYD